MGLRQIVCVGVSRCCLGKQWCWYRVLCCCGYYRLSTLKKRPVTITGRLLFWTFGLRSHFPFTGFDGVNRYHAIFQVASVGKGNFTGYAIYLCLRQISQVLAWV